jgi:hypothetical protein
MFPAFGSSAIVCSHFILFRVIIDRVPIRFSSFKGRRAESASIIYLYGSGVESLHDIESIECFSPLSRPGKKNLFSLGAIWRGKP